MIKAYQNKKLNMGKQKNKIKRKQQEKDDH
jgi:hypothetical protein